MMRRLVCLVLVACSTCGIAGNVRADVERSAPERTVPERSVPGSGWSVPDVTWSLLKRPLVSRVLKAMDGPELILEIFIEHIFGAHPGPVEVKSLLNVPQTTMKLTVLECSGHVEVAGSDTSFWGDNRVRLKVPCSYRFEIDLQHLQPANMVFDPKRRLLEIKMPAPQAARPNLDLGRVEVIEKVNPWFRSRASWLELKERIMADPLQLEAEAASQALLAEATLKARPQVRAVYQNVLDAAKSGVRVVIAD